MRLDGNKVKQARERLGYSMEVAGEQAEVSKNSVLRAEHGEDIRPVTARRISRALGVEVADLIEESARPSALDAEAREEALQGERLAREFMSQRPSEAGRIKFIEDAIDILRHYYELGQRIRSKMGEDLTLHGIGYVWHGFYFDALQPALERDGVLLHASFVVDGPAKVSERERAACEKLRDYDIEMTWLMWDMRNLDEENNARVREDGSRGVTQLSELLEDISKGVPGLIGPEESGT